MSTEQPAPLPEGWAEQGAGLCRSCYARVRWAASDKTGRRAPFDLDGTPHFATCPQAASWRRRGTP